jgi:hypothetical protein
MSVVSPATRQLARHLLLREAGGQAEPEPLAAATERISQRLRLRLILLIGPLGFAALYARALHLAKQEYPSLAMVEFRDGTDMRLIGLQKFAVDVGDPALAQAALVAVLAQFIGLLIAFIGEDLSLRFIHEAGQVHAADEPEAPGRREAGE